MKNERLYRKEESSMYIEGKYINGTDDLTELKRLRQIIFQTTEYHTSHLYNMDTSMICDKMAVHALAWMEGKAVGCGTLFYDGETYLLDRIGILEEERRKKYGDFIVRMLLDRAFQKQAPVVVIYINETVYPFFKTIGFQQTEEKNGILRCELKRGFVCRECQGN